MEGAAALRLIDADIASHTRHMVDGSNHDDLIRSQGAIRALQKFRGYFTQDLMTPKGEDE